ncbi:MAG: tetratricopeptide repeat protein [Candidatus Aenigmarchaeota archaeon]|nr:tetratricopeptide repeat protein [Candidatus Aenigmarchaeota archaeon]
MTGEWNSGLSLSERILETYYKTENTLGKKQKMPAEYTNRLMELKNELKSEMDKGKTGEEAICDYLQGLDYLKGTPITETLYSGKVNCCSATSLHLALAEMLDYELFEKCNVGNLPSHVVVRKKVWEDFYKNIDKGNVHPDSSYKNKYDECPVDRPKETILSNIFNNCGAVFYNSEKYEEGIKEFDKALDIDPENTSALLNKGAGYAHLKKYKEAINWCNKLLDIDPKNKSARKNAETISELDKEENKSF